MSWWCAQRGARPPIRCQCPSPRASPEPRHRRIARRAQRAPHCSHIRRAARREETHGIHQPRLRVSLTIRKRPSLCTRSISYREALTYPALNHSEGDVGGRTCCAVRHGRSECVPLIFSADEDLASRCRPTIHSVRGAGSRRETCNAAQWRRHAGGVSLLARPPARTCLAPPGWGSPRCGRWWIPWSSRRTPRSQTSTPSPASSSSCASRSHRTSWPASIPGAWWPSASSSRPARPGAALRPTMTGSCAQGAPSDRPDRALIGHSSPLRSDIDLTAPLLKATQALSVRAIEALKAALHRIVHLACTNDDLLPHLTRGFTRSLFVLFGALTATINLSSKMAIAGKDPLSFLSVRPIDQVTQLAHLTPVCGNRHLRLALTLLRHAGAAGDGAPRVAGECDV